MDNITQDEKTLKFLQKLKDKGYYNEDYDYSKVVYVNNTTKVVVIDKKFNTEHNIKANVLLNGTKCCPQNKVSRFLSYDEAIVYIHKLKIRTKEDWSKYTKNNYIPNNIPKSPDCVYKNKGWISWSHWLGSKIPSNRKRKFKTYDEAIVYIHTLKLKSVKEWQQYSKSNSRPDDIPSAPDCVYKNKGWISWSHWLGYISKHTKNKGYRTYSEAIVYIHTLKLKSQAEWFIFLKSGNKPDDIPYKPERFYKDEWVSISHWLGYNKKYMDFKYANQIIKSMKIKSKSEWKRLHRENKIPENIPLNPDVIYSNFGWESWDNWFGYKVSKKIKYLSFEDAKKIIHFVGLKTQKEWHIYAKSGNKPENIPSSPYNFYKNKGWISWGDWLGTYKIADQDKIYKTYDEAKSFVKSFKLQHAKEWFELYDKKNIPSDIPKMVHQTYKNKGWVSWSHFFGTIGNGKHKWTNNTLLGFIRSLKSELINLDSVELLTIINSNNVKLKLEKLNSLNKLISSKANSKEREQILDDIINKIDTSSEDDNEDIITSELDNSLEESDIVDIINQEESELSPLEPIKELKLYDNDLITASLDDENIDFLMKNQLKKLWNSVLNNKVDINQLKNEDGGDNFNIIRNWFFEEHDEVINIETPSDYIFQYKPNLMQKLVTYRLIKEKSYGNWSGTGAGKTLSAIFAGRYAGAKNVVIVCNNATVNGWVNSISEYFNNNKIYVKQQLDSEEVNPSLYTVIDKYDINFEPNSNNYLILNYETFQQGDGDNIVKSLLDNNTVDYIILDEIQNVKQREEKEESIRRNVVNKLIIHSRSLNENLLLLAMSATPIINNLTEPKKLIELMTGKVHDELDTKDSVNSGVEMYKALTRYGLRYKPDYGINVDTEFIKIDGSHLADTITKLPKGAVAEFEKTLIQTKLDGIKHCIKPGTLIYTHYVTELSNVIGEYVKSMGLSIGYYTGDNKCGLNPFKRNEIDVLIGSSPIGTGVDGIQKVCNTLIPIVLPWTSSEYDQLVGRVNRQGSLFDNVKIYIPQVEIQLDNDSIWSWDKRRYNIIKYKATLADLAMDGIIPSSLLPPKTKLVSDAQEELIEWIKRIENNEIITISREELKIPLEPKLMDYKKQTLGDFSKMNQDWSVSKSNTIYNRLSTDPSDWYYYHSLYTEKRKQWSEIPYMELAKKIKRKDFIIGDFGCGENLLSKNIPNKVHSFDYVAIDDTVTACDISNVPLDDEVLDVAVLSLALMGSNYVDYLKEAYRTLKHSGFMYISEPKNKWNGREEILKQILNDIGFTVVGDIKKTDKFLYIDAIKL